MSKCHYNYSPPLTLHLLLSFPNQIFLMEREEVDENKTTTAWPLPPAYSENFNSGDAAPAPPAIPSTLKYSSFGELR